MTNTNTNTNTNTAIVTINDHTQNVNIAGNTYTVRIVKNDYPPNTVEIRFSTNDENVMAIGEIPISDSYKLDFNNLSVNNTMNANMWGLYNDDQHAYLRAYLHSSVIGGSGYAVKDRRSYASRTLKELQTTAQSRGIPYSGLKKGELINKLKNIR
jgi:hypothetical protein